MIPTFSFHAITQAGAGGASYDPAAALFGAGEQGVAITASDFSKLWQGPGRTNQVTAVGQTVEVADDISGNGKHVTFTNVTLAQDNAGRYYFSAAGSSGTTTSIDLSATDKVTLFAGFASGTGGTATIAKFGDIGADAGSFDFGIYSGGAMLYRRASGSFGARGTASVGLTSTIVSAVMDFSGGTHATENPVMRANREDPALSNYGSGDAGSGNFGNRALTLFTGQGNFVGGLYYLILRGVASTTEEIEANEAWGATLAGPSLTFSATPTSFTDTGAATDMGTHYDTSAYARTVFTTTASEVEVAAYSNILGSLPTYAGCGVYVDGVYVGKTNPVASGSVDRGRVALGAAGPKTVSIVNGLQSKPGGSVIGTWQVSIKADAALTQTFPAATNRVLIYGDSIAVGSDALPPVRYGWAMLLRNALSPDSVALEAWGVRSLHEDCVDATARAAFVAKLAAYAPSRIYLAIGTNDYGLSKWTAANFGTAYAALLDDLHTELPSAEIFCQTPLPRTLEVANGLGSTLPDYRSQIATAVSTRTSYATLVDGTAILTTASLVDDVHPNTAGHALIATYVEGVIA